MVNNTFHSSPRSLATYFKDWCRDKISSFRQRRLLAQDFPQKSQTRCDFCGTPLAAPSPGSTGALANYLFCRHCQVLLSFAPMPDYGEASLYAPSAQFLAENIAHYERLFTSRPDLCHTLKTLPVNEIIDLAGGAGIFPRMISPFLPTLSGIRIVEVGEYASAPDLHQQLDQRLSTQTPVTFVHQDVFTYLTNSANVCPPQVLISFVHFIDHLRHPNQLIEALRNFAKGCEAYLLVYCHALDSYKSRNWFVINTGTMGEHQIVYSQTALQNLFAPHGTLIHSQVYYDDQYLIMKLRT